MKPTYGGLSGSTSGGLQLGMALNPDKFSTTAIMGWAPLSLTNNDADMTKYRTLPSGTEAA